MNQFVFDSESNGFLDDATKFHCFAMVDIGTQERFDYGSKKIAQALDKLSTADMLIGHNILRHDLPLMEKLHGWKVPQGCVIRDTKVCARLIYPNVKDTDAALIRQRIMPPGNAYQGKHTIAAWGYRIGIPKLHEDITDWSEWTAEMHERCIGDTETNRALWEYLKADKYSQDAIELEQRVDVLVWRMERCGVPFNVRKAGELHADLVERKDVLEKQLVAQFGAWLQPISPNPAKSVATPKVNNKAKGVVKGQPFTKLKWVTFNPGSRDHIAWVLLKRGWKPTSFTPGGKPEIDENAVEAIVAQFPEMAGLGEYLMVEKRLSKLVEGKTALLKCVKDGRIHGVINPMGTTTSRASHFHPNLSQVPSNKKPYGERFRDCFEVVLPWVLVGADQEGLEGRGFAHYMHPLDGGAYAEALLSGDPHWASAKALDFVPHDLERDKHDQLHIILREGGKRFYYAFLYGAWDEQCGIVILDTANDARKAGYPEPYRQFFGDREVPGERLIKAKGKLARENFMLRTPGMDKLLKLLAGQVERFGYLKGLDGRFIPIRSEHSALNFLIQSCGAILCKRWIVEAFDEIVSRGYRHGWDGDFVFCLWNHDEIQVACRREIAEEIGEIIVKQARAVGQHYGFRVPLDSKYSIGQSWADTH